MKSLQSQMKNWAKILKKHAHSVKQFLEYKKPKFNYKNDAIS